MGERGGGGGGDEKMQFDPLFQEKKKVCKNISLDTVCRIYLAK